MDLLGCRLEAKKKMTSYFSGLPEDVSVQLWSFFDAECLARAAGTCTVFRKRSDVESLWQQHCQIYATFNSSVVRSDLRFGMPSE